MKRLLLLRHARAAPAVAGDDFCRELTPGGEEDAARIGAYIAAEGLQADYVIHSAARRALDTARLALARWTDPPEPVTELALYDATRHFLLALARGFPLGAASALIVGHNPGVGELASWLSGEGDPGTRLRIAGQYLTGALAVLTFDAPDWADIGPRKGRLERYVTPADLGAR